MCGATGRLIRLSITETGGECSYLHCHPFMPILSVGNTSFAVLVVSWHLCRVAAYVPNLKLNSHHRGVIIIYRLKSPLVSLLVYSRIFLIYLLHDSRNYMKYDGSVCLKVINFVHCSMTIAVIIFPLKVPYFRYLI